MILLLACRDPDVREAAGETGDSAGDSGSGDSGSADSGSGDSGSGDSGDSGDSRDSGETDVACTTTITYGDRWIHDAATHPTDYDVADGLITWDGVCTPDAYGNSYAVLSNGWAPYFEGPSGCVIALDSTAGCADRAPACRTLVSYGASWIPADNHPDYWDLVDGRVFAGACVDEGAQAHLPLSNGWEPWFTGDCAVSFRYEQCGGLYANPVVAVDCPDPGVTAVDGGYVMVCTGGASSGGAFPIRTSPDLVHWTEVGALLPTLPAWASGDFWAPEVHAVGGRWVAYFTARAADDGQLSIGAAVSDSPTGPFTDLGGPLLRGSGVGVIDATLLSTDAGPYLVWKDDGNAIGQPTPIRAAPLADDGLSVIGASTTLITNDQGWEGSVVEGPWIVEHDGAWLLFYSGNSYASTAYAVGVARASAPLGPYTKAGGPILVTGDAWAGPGHGSWVTAPGGDLYGVVHAWQAGHVGTSPGRLVLVEQVQWADGWPVMRGAPSSGSRPGP